MMQYEFVAYRPHAGAHPAELVNYGSRNFDSQSRAVEHAQRIYRRDRWASSVTAYVNGERKFGVWKAGRRYVVN